MIYSYNFSSTQPFGRMGSFPNIIRYWNKQIISNAKICVALAGVLHKITSNWEALILSSNT